MTAESVAAPPGCARPLEESARDIMARNPSPYGWVRVEAQRCGSHVASPTDRSVVLWRRRVDMLDAYAVLDPPIWVAERVSPVICIGDSWAYMQNDTAPLTRMSCPWRFSAWRNNRLIIGSTVTLKVANGSWIWQITGNHTPNCRGYLAVWQD